MMKIPLTENRDRAAIEDATRERLRSLRVLIVGLGNIGSALVLQLAPLITVMRLVDRDLVEPHNVDNQFYSRHDVQRSKVEATADRIAEHFPSLNIERHATDLELLPWEAFAGVDLILAGLDGRRPRQLLAEKAAALGVPYIDGAVGEPMLVRVQVFVPGGACLECGWGPSDYRQLAAEYPCRPRPQSASATATETGRQYPTGVPSCAGSAAASLMVAQCVRMFSEAPPRESYEINVDLLSGQSRSGHRRRNLRCRSPHERPPRLLPLGKRFAEATVADLIAELFNAFGTHAVQLEFRRGILPGDLFDDDRYTSLDQLRRFAHRPLDQFGLTSKDRVVAWRDDPTHKTHVCFQPAKGDA